jgi:hypothetical protein
MTVPSDIDRKNLAEDFGFALAFLKSDKSLWNLFNDAVKNDWDVARFTAKLKGTSWYKKNGESARQYELLRTSDPASFNAKRGALGAQIKDAASQLGAVVSGSMITRITQNAMKFGWNDAQIRDTLSQYVRATNGVYGGQAGNDIATVRQTAYRNGIKISKATEQKWAQAIASGNQTADFYQRQVRSMAKSLAPGFATELDSGVDLQDIVSPFIETKAKILEMNPADIDLFDNDIRSAISGTTKDGSPGSKSLWQFEQDMRKSPAWLKTQNAQDSTMAVGKKVLQDMGFQGVS